MTVIKVENLSKKYTIRHEKKERYATLRDVVATNVKNLSQIIFPSKTNKSEYQKKEVFWALKDINFTVNQGDRVGIIGRNGAGKSTLLKILSRITEPTTGRISIKGRVASLLEVGTGFHPELTGRENIFLNGAILGMSKIEIKRRFDEIVAFAEVEMFLDTPVKRFSSGMRVRLAFAVAAHLEPEILLVDEVLAVGDIGFQSKCLGKMQNVSNEGRTILFVSHNLAMIKSLCNRTILLDQSKIIRDSATADSIDKYLNNNKNCSATFSWQKHPKVMNDFVSFRKAFIEDEEKQIVSSVEYDKDFFITIQYEIHKPVKNLRIGFMLQNNEGTLICGSNDPVAWKYDTRNKGIYRSCCRFPRYILSEGIYSLCFGADKFPYDTPLISTDYCLTFSVYDKYRHGHNKEKLPGVIKPKLQWTISTT